MDETGLGGERLDFFHIAASEAPIFTETAKEMTERAKNLGPNPYRTKLQQKSEKDKEQSMIIAKRKPFEEIKESVKDYNKITVLGCGTCVAVCQAGGEKEVEILASELRLAFGNEGKKLISMKNL